MSSTRRLGSYATSNSAYGETDRFGRTARPSALGKLADIHEGRKRHRSVGDQASDFSQQTPLSFNARRKSMTFVANEQPSFNSVIARSRDGLLSRRRRHSFTGVAPPIDGLAPPRTPRRVAVPRLNLPDAVTRRYQPLSSTPNSIRNHSHHNNNTSTNHSHSHLGVDLESEQDDVFLPCTSSPTWTTGTERPRTSQGQKPQYGVMSEAGEKGRQRKTNQDGFLMIHSPGVNSGNKSDFVAGVFDGHGRDGHCVSHFIKERLGTRMQEAHKQFRPQSSKFKDVSRHMEEAFKHVESDLGKVSFDATNSGSTAVICARKGDKLIVANVGDSRAVLGRSGSNQNMEAVALTIDHTLNNPSEQRRATAAGGEVEPIYVHGQGMMGPPRLWKKKQQEGGLAVSRAFGDMSLKGAGCSAVPEVFVKTISPNDHFVILASDGVWDHVSNQQAVDIASRHSDPRQASEEIVKLARGRWKKTEDSYVDDITALVTRL
eukprot:m.76745 g.76745  ORF g.76745 m.76745 type:complete len:488 (-) comp24929_c1_seq1:83-1546(-)